MTTTWSICVRSRPAGPPARCRPDPPPTDGATLRQCRERVPEVRVVRGRVEVARHDRRRILRAPAPSPPADPASRWSPRPAAAGSRGTRPAGPRRGSAGDDDVAEARVAGRRPHGSKARRAELTTATSTLVALSTAGSAAACNRCTQGPAGAPGSPRGRRPGPPATKPGRACAPGSPRPPPGVGAAAEHVRDHDRQHPGAGRRRLGVGELPRCGQRRRRSAPAPITSTAAIRHPRRTSIRTPRTRTTTRPCGRNATSCANGVTSSRPNSSGYSGTATISEEQHRQHDPPDEPCRFVIHAPP